MARPRETLGVWLLNAFWADLRFAIRSGRAAPAVTATATLVLALGIAANTLVFSVIETTLLRPVPYDAPNALVLINVRSPASEREPVAFEDYRDWRRDTTSFEALAAGNSETFNLTGMGDPEQVSGSNVSAALFDVLRVRPFLGRLFTEEDDHSTAAPVVVITHASWRNRFNADPAILGRMIVLDAVPRAIVGVLPPGVRYPVTDSHGEIFSPLGRLELDLAGRANRSVTVVGRLKPGVSLHQAQADLDRVAGRLAAEHPATNRDVRARVDGYADRVTASSATLLRALWGAVVLVWFVACANAASVLAIRNAARAREFATRLSLGATRARLSAQVLTESLALATVAGSLGVIAAALTLPVLVAVLPSDLPRVADIALDGRVLGYTGLCTLVTAVLAALLPAWHTARLPLFRTASVPAPAIAANSGVRAALVIGQLALSYVLLVGAALLMTTLARLLHTDPGFQPDRVATALYYLPDASYVTRERIVGFHRAFIDRVSHLPGIAAAGLLTPPPFGMGGGQADVVIEGRDGTIRIDGFRASPGALSALGAPLRAGRFFDDRDGDDSPMVAVIDEQFARQYLGRGDPLGRRLRLARSNVWMPIVGVAGHIVTRSLEVPDRPQIYLPLFGTSLHFTSVLVRTDGGPPMARMADVRAVARQLDPALPLFNAASMTTLISGTTGRQRLGAYVLTAFSGAALVLAAIGVAGIVGYSVTLRAREYGIRLALGARPRALVAGLVTHGCVLTLVGLMLGLVGGLAAAHVFSALVPGTQVLTPALIGTALALLGAGAVASYLPARRVASIDLVTILRRE